LTVSGVFKNSIQNISFDSVAVDVTHKRDIDQWEDGCIARVDIILSQKGTGCQLMVTASSTLDSKEKLAIQSMILVANSQCPDFADKVEGMYTLSRQGQGTGLELGITEVPDQNAKESCFNSTMTLRVGGEMRREGNADKMRVEFSSFEIRGDFSSSGDESVSCPCRPVQRIRPRPRPRPRIRPRPAPVEEPEPSGATFDLIVGLGTNTCLDSGDAECGDDSTHFAFLVGLGSRISSNFGLYLDTSYGRLYPDADNDTSTLTIMPTARVFAPFSNVELMAGFGVGYSSETTTFDHSYFGNNIETSWSSFISMKLSTGLVFKVDESIGLGMMLDYVIHVDETGEYCFDDECDDNDGDVTDLLQFYFMMKASF